MSDNGYKTLEQAQADVQRAKKQLASTLGALRYSLSPQTIMSNAWEGVRGKSGDLAEEAIQAVRERPATASGVVAAVLIFLARDPLWSLVSGWFSGDGDADLVTTRLDEKNGNYDLTAPTVDRTVNEGVDA